MQSTLSNFRSILYFSVLLLKLPALANAAPAFPGAQGFGSGATGGRGGDVYIVTSLADDGQPGTFRHGLISATGPRIIVFEVGGNIQLNSTLKVESDNITIAGQTAPGDGITVWGYPFIIKGDGESAVRNNVVIRYMRFRCGDYNAIENGGDLKGKNGDGITVLHGNKVMLDHLSISWSMDEALGITHSTEITVQNCIIAEALHDSYHDKGTHSNAALITGLNSASEMSSKTNGYTLVGNLLAHSNTRNPVVGGEKGTDPNVVYRGLNIDFANNVVYNWGERSGHTASNAFIHMNYMDNYLVAGPSTAQGIPNKNINPATAMRVEQETTDDIDSFFIYHKGNFMDTDQDLTHDGSLVGDEAFINFEAHERLCIPHGFPTSVGGLDAESAYDFVLANAGASLSRDAIDTRVVNEVITRTGAIIDSQDEVGGIVPLAGGTAPTDTDRDGMPDSWETANGTNPNVIDNSGDVNGDGYDNIENYINSLVGDLPPPPSGSIVLDGCDANIVTGSCGMNVDGFTGGGFANTFNTVGTYVEWTGVSTNASTYTATLRYANGGGAARAGDVSINGTVQASIIGANTGAWENWAEETFSVSLNAGSNTIRFTGTGASSLVNIDRLALTEDDSGSGTLDIRISASSDDAEQSASSIIRGSSDLEIVNNGGFSQTVGLRFNGVTIPQGSIITKAYVQFTADEIGTAAASLIIKGEDVDDSATFTSGATNISDRTLTKATRSWSPLAWNTVGESDSAQKTSGIKPIIQEIVDRGGWASGNSLSIIITGTGKRVAESFDGSSSQAPLLHVEYTDSSPLNVNQPVAISQNKTCDAN